MKDHSPQRVWLARELWLLCSKGSTSRKPQQEAQATPLHHTSRDRILLLQPLPTPRQLQDRRTSAAASVSTRLPQELGQDHIWLLFEVASLVFLNKKIAISILARAMSITIGTHMQCLASTLLALHYRC